MDFENIDVKVEGRKLILTIDLEEDHGLSASGKTRRVASTEGNKVVATRKDGTPVYLGLNAYVKAK